GDRCPACRAQARAARARAPGQRRARLPAVALRGMAAARRRRPQVERNAAQGRGPAVVRPVPSSGGGAGPIQPVGDGARRERRARVDDRVRAAARVAGHALAAGTFSAVALRGPRRYAAIPTWNVTEYPVAGEPVGVTSSDARLSLKIMSAAFEVGLLPREA